MISVFTVCIVFCFLLELLWILLSVWPLLGFRGGELLFRFSKLYQLCTWSVTICYCSICCIMMLFCILRCGLWFDVLYDFVKECVSTKWNGMFYYTVCYMFSSTTLFMPWCIWYYVPYYTMVCGFSYTCMVWYSKLWGRIIYYDVMHYAISCLIGYMMLCSDTLFKIYHDLIYFMLFNDVLWYFILCWNSCAALQIA